MIITLCILINGSNASNGVEELLKDTGIVDIVPRVKILTIANEGASVQYCKGDVINITHILCNVGEGDVNRIEMVVKIPDDNYTINKTMLEQEDSSYKIELDEHLRNDNFSRINITSKKGLDKKKNDTISYNLTISKSATRNIQRLPIPYNVRCYYGADNKVKNAKIIDSSQTGGGAPRSKLRGMQGAAALESQ